MTDEVFKKIDRQAFFDIDYDKWKDGDYYSIQKSDLGKNGVDWIVKKCRALEIDVKPFEFDKDVRFLVSKRFNELNERLIDRLKQLRHIGDGYFDLTQFCENGISRPKSREFLDSLCDAGSLQVKRELPRSGVGRPRYVYYFLD